jgi:hypothetical protein
MKESAVGYRLEAVGKTSASSFPTAEGRERKADSSSPIMS